jgi:hypothetical protein
MQPLPFKQGPWDRPWPVLSLSKGRATGAAARLRATKTGEVRQGSQFKQGPRDWLRQTAGAAAPPGLEPAAPNLLEQVWTGARREASGERRPARCRELHAVSDRGGHGRSAGPPQARPAPSGGRELHAVSDRGGHGRSAGPPQARPAPSGGRELHAVRDRGGHGRSAGPPQARPAPSGGRELHAVSDRGGHILTASYPHPHFCLRPPAGHRRPGTSRQSRP